MEEINRILANSVSTGASDGKLLGKTLISSSAGSLSFSETSGASFTPESVSWIASMTKLVTAVAVLQVVEKSLIGLDDDLGQVVPDLADLKVLEGYGEDGKPVLTKSTKAMTLRRLLTHSSGFGYDTFDPRLIKWRASIGRELTSNAFTFDSLKIPLLFTPGEGWTYGIGLDWAGRVVEVVSGLSLEEYMRKHIFDPLGMQSTTFRISERPDLETTRAETGLRTDPKGSLTSTQTFKPDTTEIDAGGVGLYSTAGDYGKLLGALLDDGGMLLSASSTRELLRSQLPDSKYLEEHLFGPYQAVLCPEYPRGTNVNYALAGAVNMEDLPGRRRKNSVMWSGLTNPRWWLDPSTGIAAVLMVQVLPPGDTQVSELYEELERAIYRHFGTNPNGMSPRAD